MWDHSSNFKSAVIVYIVKSVIITDLLHWSSTIVNAANNELSAGWENLDVSYIWKIVWIVLFDCSVVITVDVWTEDPWKSSLNELGNNVEIRVNIESTKLWRSDFFPDRFSLLLDCFLCVFCRFKLIKTCEHTPSTSSTCCEVG